MFKKKNPDIETMAVTAKGKKKGIHSFISKMSSW